MGAITPSSKLKKLPSVKKPGKFSGAFQTFDDDPLDDLARARQGFVKNTGGKLGDVKNAGAYKKFTEKQKKEYRRRNPQDFKEEENVFTLGKPTLLGS
tara:strand:+ start:218 stop:511 length:294 start_codon:yes stop_codon:yes gene_type:complete